MDSLFLAWRDNAAVFAIGSVLWIGVGALVVARVRTPLWRQRTAELAALGWVGWLLLAFTRPPSAAAPAPSIVPESNAARSEAVVESAIGSVPLTEAGAVPAGWGLAELLGVVLLAGGAALTVWLFASWLLLLWTLCRARPAGAVVRALLPEDQRRVRVLVSDAVAGPFCCGLLRPAVVLPGGLARGDAGVLRAVLAHEAAHLRRGDLRGRALFAAMMPLLFWHPAYWWLRREARRAAEVLADASAAAQISRAAYARAMIDLAERLPTVRRARAVALGMVTVQTEFGRRMEMLLQREGVPLLRGSRWLAFAHGAAVVVLAQLSSLAWTSPLRAAQDPAPVASKSEKTAVGKNEAKAVERGVTRVKVAFEYAAEQDLGTVVTRLGKAGYAVEEMKIDPASDSRRATVVLRLSHAMTRDVVGRLDKLVEPAQLTMFMPMKPAPAPARKAADAQLPRVMFAFEDSDVGDVIATIAKITGTNIVVHPDVRGRVTVRLRNVPARDALQVTVRQVGAIVIEEGDLLRVVPESAAPPKK